MAALLPQRLRLYEFDELEYVDIVADNVPALLFLFLVGSRLFSFFCVVIRRTNLVSHATFVFCAFLLCRPPQSNTSSVVAFVALGG